MKATAPAHRSKSRVQPHHTAKSWCLSQPSPPQTTQLCMSSACTGQGLGKMTKPIHHALPRPQGPHTRADPDAGCTCVPCLDLSLPQSPSPTSTTHCITPNQTPWQVMSKNFRKQLKTTPEEPYNRELGQPRSAAFIQYWINLLLFSPEKGQLDMQFLSTQLFTTNNKLLKVQSSANLISSRGLNFLHLQRQVWQDARSGSLPKGILGPFPKFAHS